MPFLSKGARTYKGRIKGRDGERHIVTLGTTDYDLAVSIEHFARELAKGGRRWDVLDAVLDGKLTIAEAYDRRADLDTLLEERTTPDLDALVDEWAKTVEGTRYEAQVRVFVPKGQRFPLTEFRRANVSKFLRNLPVGLYTRRKYKVALSSLAKFLLERELLEANPVRDVDLGRAKGARPVIHLPPADVRTLVEAIDNPKYQAMEALMAGAGVEYQAVVAVTPRGIDFDRRLVLARGEKNRYRTRWVEVTEDWAWDIFVRYVRLFTPDARPFEHVDHGWFLKSHHEAAERKGLRRTTPHHHRHSYALKWLPHALSNVDDRNTGWLKNQLGHAPQSNVLFTTYAVEIKAIQLTAAQQTRILASPAKRAAGITRRRR